MTWSEHHRRGDVVRAVVDHLDLHRDGRLPMDPPGVRAVFADELDIVGALQLVWHQRLTGLIERHQSDQPLALRDAVETAWLEAARWMPGVRTALDRCTDHPTDDVMGRALARAAAKERSQLALAAGLASAPDHRAETVGRHLERSARARWRPRAPHPAEPVVRRQPTGSPAFVARLKAVLDG